MRLIINLTRPLIPSLLLACGSTSLAQEVSIPDLGLNAAIREALQKPIGPLSEQDLLSLTGLNASGRSINSVEGLQAARNLTMLALDSNSITNFAIAGALTNLAALNLFNNHLTEFVLPGVSPKLTVLNLGFNALAQCSLPDGLTNLDTLFLEGNRLTNFTLPAGLTALRILDLAANGLTTFALRADMTNLVTTLILANQLTNLTVPASLKRLGNLNLNFNRLPSLDLPAGLTNFGRLDAAGNQLTNFFIPVDMANLSVLDLRNNQLTNLTLPPGLTKLTALFIDGNPLASFVLSEPLAATSLAATVAALRSQGVAVFTYPLTVQLVGPLQLVGAFKFGIAGPPGVYTILGSTNLTVWTAVGVATNPLGSIDFVDVTANASPKRFYRALLQSPPANMVFIPPNTFTMGTLVSEVNRQPDEGPQTTVTISHGFWIGKYEVTQREYQAVIGSNPSQFPSNLDRPVETVSWLDATNYCAQLTQQELAAGRISPGCHYRLPTEAEWECAARAGTSTRFSYGDDPNFNQLANYSWYSFNSGFGTHQVGQKLPNPWGLYDMEGNVLEWTQDWYGPYPGGFAADPQGPASNVQGVKVIRGGAWDAGEADCRSGRRLTEGVSPFIHDFILGFRVVLDLGPK